MSIIYLILAVGAGIAIDRAVIWDKDRAVTQERKYHIGTIHDLQNRLQKSNMERFAAERNRGNDVDPDDFIFTNPSFEEDFLCQGRAKTHIVRVGSLRRGERRLRTNPR